MKRLVQFIILLAAMLVVPAGASAQHRAVPRPAPPHGGYGGARPYYPGYYRPYYYGYYRPYYPAFGFSVGYAGWYGAFGWGWYGAYGYPYYGYGGYPYGYPSAWGYPYPYPYPAYWNYSSAARIQVQPRHAEVFVDGHFVGLVDDFDGWAQRLDVAPGEHELSVYLAGYRTFREHVLFRPGATLRIEHVLQPLAAGEPQDPRPAPAPGPPAGRPVARPPYPGDEGDPQYQPGAPVPAPRRGPPPPPRGAESQEYGSLAVRVQPLDAEVLVDGEPWQSPQAGNITLQLSGGLHKIEVRKSGYRTYSAEVRVRRGDTTSLNVSLSRE